MDQPDVINDMLDVITRHISLAELNDRQIAKEPERYLEHLVELLLQLGAKVGAPGEACLQFSISPYSRPRVVFQMAKPPKQPAEWQTELMQSELGEWIRYSREIGKFQVELWSMH